MNSKSSEIKEEENHSPTVNGKGAEKPGTEESQSGANNGQAVADPLDPSEPDRPGANEGLEQVSPLGDPLDELVEENQRLKDENRKLAEEYQRTLRNLADERTKNARLESKLTQDRKFDGVPLARTILTSYDDLNRAIAAGQQNQGQAENFEDAWIKGIEAVRRGFEDALKRHNIQAIMPKVGDIFDHNHHDAKYNAPVPGCSNGQIVEVLKIGFRFHDRVLRYAEVGVAESAGESGENGVYPPDDESSEADSSESSKDS